MHAKVIPATRTALGKNQEFSYLVPRELENQLNIGMIVEVPFGRRNEQGVVTAIGDDKNLAYKIKSINKIVWQEAIFTKQLLEVAKFVSEKYLVSLGLVVKVVIVKYAPRAKMLERFIRAKRNDPNFQLTEHQQTAVKTIMTSAGSPKTFLLHGVTGSGKTEIYIRVIESLLKKGKQALVMVPEISLTPQTLSRFAERFDENEIAVVHSKISYGQKFLIWQKVYHGEVKILIGPRSAVFAPFKNLGIIIIDEEHDSSYKQFDQNPKYHAREVSKKLSAIWSCPLILGDATPSVETFYDAAISQIEKLELPSRIKQNLPPVKLIDMRQEVKLGNFSIFSETLIKQIEKELAQKHQVILFINRRGTATSMICKDCGLLSMCTRCAVPLVYHQSMQKLVCHHCNKKYDIPIKCDKCKSHNLRFTGTGTEKVEEEIRRVFTKARIRRLDRDAITKKAELENLYHDFKEQKFDILVGTQLLAKGWDLSHVGLIGIINADTILQLPDFRSNERTFQLITQAAGRTGRGDFPGNVVLQTYNPENFAIQAATQHDYQKFFRKEIQDRENFTYPPFSNLIKLTIKHPNEKLAWQKADALVNDLRQVPDISKNCVIGPAAGFIPRLRGRYFVYVIIKLPKKDIPDNLLKKIQSLGSEWDIDVDPDSLL